MYKFVHSGFYAGSRLVSWIAAVIFIGSSSDLTGNVIVLLLALGYSTLPVLIANISPPPRSEIENFKNTSPIIAYLSTLFDDISHINAISGDFGVAFNSAKITLSTFPRLRLYPTPDEDRIGFIQRYHDAAVSWWRGEGEKSPDELQREFSGYFRYDGDGYTAKNALFREELEKESLGEVKYDSSGWYIDLRGLLAVVAGQNRMDRIAITAITECVEAHGYHISNHHDGRPDEYILWVTFY